VDGIAIALVGLWVVLQFTKGGLASVIF